jgi:transcriptional regulator with PAS, ATPase and Fis domain
MQPDWIKEFPAAITVCDNEGIITGMNDKSAASFEKDGGYDLIGKNLFNCHKQSLIDKIKDIQKDNKSNIYTIEKNGIKKLIFQTTYCANGEVKGLVEIVFEIPFEIPHFVR